MSIFKELNDVKLDVNEFEEIPISDIVQKRIKNKVHKKMYSKKLMKRKKKSYFLAAIATLLVVSSITLNIAFPAFASKLPNIGNIFDLFVSNERYVFEEFGDHSTDIGITKESNGVSITVTNAVYDKENITIAYSIKSEQDLGIRPVLLGKMVVKEFGEQYKHNGFFESYIVEKINDNEYAVVYIYELIKGTKPDSINVSWQGDFVQDLNNVSQLSPGNWSFEFTLDALERKINEYDSGEVIAVDAGVEVELIKMTETPISTTIYLTEKVDERLVAKEDEDLRTVGIEYKVTDNLGTNYKYIHYRDTGHSTDFNEDHRSNPRITINVVDKDVTHIEITPIVTAYKVANPNQNGDGFLEPVIESYSIESIHIPL
ncbi:anti-sigma factor [Solibacillus sp. R5-41]|uniref:DUF4179 domain-containing protein n=1 Tax=Solibacillus sp. R5-41 TaxID=2048654 RepID=UPI000C127C32|nr:DUF4179 domain-containing protein [Solibacillus sp. R5-41]ATP39862.1 anti-sigma factor [Solibacillus sp. R5-41]